MVDGVKNQLITWGLSPPRLLLKGGAARQAVSAAESARDPVTSGGPAIGGSQRTVPVVPRCEVFIAFSWGSHNANFITVRFMVDSYDSYYGYYGIWLFMVYGLWLHYGL